ncbi:L,D-transpeptidase [Patescibacteria group bacterium]|nr:L,D-transpeptidase [Patescibacteria group bacterium]
MQIKNIKIFFVVFIFLAVLVLPFYIFPSQAKDNFDFLKIYNAQTLALEKSIPLFNSVRGYSISTIDLGGDGQSEILIGAGPGEKPWVKILRSDGSVINSFLVYAENFLGGVEVQGCDFDADGRGEILTGARSKGGAHVRIFDGFGKPKINSGFFAFQNNLGHGAQITCADINGDKKDEIVVVGNEDGQKQIKIFNSFGNLLKTKNINFSAKNLSLSAIDLGGDGIEEILIAGGLGDEPKVQIYRGDLSLVNEFLVYAQNFLNGTRVIGGDVDKDQKGEIITLPGIGGNPHLRFFNGYGKEKITDKSFVFDPPSPLKNSTGLRRTGENFKFGLDIALGDVDGDAQMEILTLPRNLPSGRADLYKYIDIDVSEQRFRYYQNGVLMDDLQTSTGKPSTPTRLGEFTAFSKYEMAYGYADGVKWGMPYFIGFYMSGGLENGIHELPFLNGYREGERSLGHAVSHGCVRLQIGPAKELYDWVEIGKTNVIVHK